MVKISSGESGYFGEWTFWQYAPLRSFPRLHLQDLQAGLFLDRNAQERSSGWLPSWPQVPAPKKPLGFDNKQGTILVVLGGSIACLLCSLTAGALMELPFAAHSQGSCEAPASCEEAPFPIASYFCFSRLENTESLRLPKGKLSSDSPNLRGVQSDIPPKVDALNAFPHLETTQKSQRKKKICMRTRRSPKNTVVLELEETLAVSSLTTHWEDASTFTVHFQGQHYKVFFKLRPHLEEFLEELAKIYEVFIFTAAKQDYADKILEAIGPQRKLIRHRLYQEDCLCSQGYYIKDLSVLERDLARTVAVANCLEAFPYQTSNVILIPKWQGSPEDKELLHLIPVLKRLTQVDDIRAEIETKHRGKPTEEA